MRERICRALAEDGKAPEFTVIADFSIGGNIRRMIGNHLDRVPTVGRVFNSLAPLVKVEIIGVRSKLGSRETARAACIAEVLCEDVDLLYGRNAERIFTLPRFRGDRFTPSLFATRFRHLVA